MDGWINIDKPYGFSSAKVVAIVKRKLNVKKVGHGGTLDPLATGVLPICINRATKTTEKMMSFEKEYTFILKFGETRATGDEEGEIIEKNSKIPNETDIINILPKFTGDILQTPPAFSAIKINGKRAYELARQDKEVKIEPRIVKILDSKFIGFSSENEAIINVKCGKGFYIRSFAVDIAKELGCLGYVSKLRRNSVGIFNETNILQIEDLDNFKEEFLITI